MIQVLASEEGIKQVPKAKVVDLLDAIEKNVRIKEAAEKESRRKSKRSSAASSPVPSPRNNRESPVGGKPRSPLKPPAPCPHSTKRASTPTSAPRGGSTPASAPRGGSTSLSLTDCLPPQITAAILPAIKVILNRTQLELRIPILTLSMIRKYI